MRTLTLETKREGARVRIFCGAGARERVAEELVLHPKYILFTDENVEFLYREWIDRAFPGPRFVMRAGEEYKTEETLFALLRAMAAAGLHRPDCLVALGGGVVGDIGGLASSLYMRGISCVQVPTTLLAQVDSSVGGKTAIDLDGVKNLVGSFFQPDAVFADPSFFSTLPSGEIDCGLGEMVKHSALDPSLFEKMRQGKERLHDLDFISSLVEDNIAFKASVVARDTEEKGIRKSLNLGHTTAHALELALKRYSHGECVLIGMMLEGEIACDLGLCDGDFFVQIKELCLAALRKMPELPPFGDALRLALLDKKNTDDGVTLTLSKGIGEVAFVTLPFAEYEQRIECARRKLC